MIIFSSLMLILGFFGLITGIVLVCIKKTRKAGIITTISSVVLGTVFFVTLIFSSVNAVVESTSQDGSETDSSGKGYSYYGDDSDEDSSTDNDESSSDYVDDSSDDTSDYTEEATEDTEKKETSKESNDAKTENDNVPTEYKSALASAESYSSVMHMSKAGIYDQLVSEYGDQFSAEAAQYAVDNLKADYKANALLSAKDYQESMSMSPEAIRDQLTSESGEKFTQEEADFAVQHLN